MAFRAGKHSKVYSSSMGSVRNPAFQSLYVSTRGIYSGGGNATGPGVPQRHQNKKKEDCACHANATGPGALPRAKKSAPVYYSVCVITAKPQWLAKGIYSGGGNATGPGVPQRHQNKKKQDCACGENATGPGTLPRAKKCAPAYYSICVITAKPQWLAKLQRRENFDCSG